MPDDQFPVEWTGRQAIVAFPEHVDISNVDQFPRSSAVRHQPWTCGADRRHDRYALVRSRRGGWHRTGLPAGCGQRNAIQAGRRRSRHQARARHRRAGSPGPHLSLAGGSNCGRKPTEGILGPPAIPPPQPDVRLPRSTADSTAPTGITPAVLWQLIDALGDGLALTGEDGTIALVNRRCAELFGYQREELIGLPVDSLVPSDVRTAHQGYRVRYTRAPDLVRWGSGFGLAGLRKDGATFPVEISLSPVPTTTEKFVLAVIRDATETQWRDDLANLARGAVADQWRSTKDLLDRVTQRVASGRAEPPGRGRPTWRRGSRASQRSLGPARRRDPRDPGLRVQLRRRRAAALERHVAPGLVSDPGRYLGYETPDRRVGDTVQDRPIQSLAQCAERGPVHARHGEHSGSLASAAQPDVGVQDRE